jgi:hypothetical protein
VTRSARMGRALHALALALAGGTLVAACASDVVDTASSATFPRGQLPAGLSEVLLARENSPWLLGSIPICSSSSMAVAVTSVTAVDPAFEVTGFAVRRDPGEADESDFMDARGDLAANDVEPESIEMSQPCTDNDSPYELVIEVRSTTTDTSTPGFTVDYVSAGKHGSTFLRYEVHSCVDRSTPDCAGMCIGGKHPLPGLPRCKKE